MQDQENKELRMKLKRQLTFKNEMDNISKNYAQFEQQIYYSPLKNINPNMIIKIEAKQPKQQNKKSTIFGKRQDFYMINGQFQPQGDKSFEKLILQIVQTIPRPTKPFGMIYINTFADGSAYNDFKKVLQLLPIQYFFNLTKIYVLQPSFFNKTSFWFSFGTITNYIKNKTINIDYIQDLSKHTKFDLDYLLKLLPKNVSIYFKEIEIKAANLRREQQQNRKYVQLKFLADRKSQLAQNPKIVSYESSIFEACLPQNLQKVKSDQTYGFNHQSTGDLASKSEVKKNNNQKKIQEYQLGPTGAPIILQLLIYYFNSKQQALKLQGIFRKSVSIDDQTEILAQLHHKNYNCIEKIDNPHVIANAIKRFLANLKIPLINFELFNYFMTLEQNQKLHPLVVQKIKQLPKINRMTLFILLDFLMNKVLKYAEMSKMSLNNLCIVFGPCLMRSEVASIKDLIYAKKIITITNVFFIQFQSIFGSTHEQNKLKRASYKQYKKEDMMHKIIVSPPKQQKPIEIAQHNADIKQKSQNVQNLGQLNLMNRTSQFIKQSLEIDEDDEQTESIGQEQAKAVIMLSNQMKIEIGQIQESIPKQKNIASSHFKFDSSIGTSSSHPKLHEQNNKSNNTINI